jgi:hypothetical protein
MDHIDMLTRDEVDAMITNRILAFYQKLQMDGRLLDEQRPSTGFTSGCRADCTQQSDRALRPTAHPETDLRVHARE